MNEAKGQDEPKLLDTIKSLEENVKLVEDLVETTYKVLQKFKYPFSDDDENTENLIAKAFDKQVSTDSITEVLIGHRNRVNEGLREINGKLQDLLYLLG